MIAAHRMLRLWLGVTACLQGANVLAAQDATLLPSDTPVQFGYSVSVSGDTAVVAAYQGIQQSGAAYVFVTDSITWTEEAKLVLSDGAVNDLVGAVAIDGDIAVVGSGRDDHAGGVDAGSAYVFVRSGGIWSEEAKLTASNARAEDCFGASVAIFGNTIVVGAPGDDGPLGFNAGSIYVFVRDGTSWAQQANLLGAEVADSDQFGASVSISAETILVGAPWDWNGGEEWAGSAYVFVRNGTVWTQQAKLLANDHGRDDWFGYSVALSGETALIGTPKDSAGALECGSAYVFSRVGMSWTQQAKLIASDSAGREDFGWSVSVSGSAAVIGAPHDSNYAVNAGAAYVFMKGDAGWAQQEKLVSKANGERFVMGLGVAVQDTRALVGTPTDLGAVGVVYEWSLPTNQPLPPLASFYGSPLEGRAPLTVQFTDLSTGPITNWLWDFGNGYLSTLQNPVFTYNEPGESYSITLTVTGPGGTSSHVEQDLIRVLPRIPRTHRVTGL